MAAGTVVFASSPKRGPASVGMVSMLSKTLHWYPLDRLQFCGSPQARGGSLHQSQKLPFACGAMDVQSQVSCHSHATQRCAAPPPPAAHTRPGGSPAPPLFAAAGSAPSSASARIICYE